MKILSIDNTAEALFIQRENRFIATAMLQDNRIVKIHVHDTGRLSELLYSNNRILIKYIKSKKRKTEWDLIAAFSFNGWILVNSAYHRQIGDIFLRSHKSPFQNISHIKPEAKLGDSRIDYYLEANSTDNPETLQKIWIEVKGCNLLEGNTALFPDAPTLRGVKHVNELINVIDNNTSAALMFFIFVNTDIFKPNKIKDPLFTETLKNAVAAGVQVYPIVFNFNGEAISYKRIIEFSF